MPNSSLITYTQISPCRTSPRKNMIERITVHCFVGQVTAQGGCKHFSNPIKKKSCNYVVGYDGSIGLCVEEKDRSWCSSSADNDNRAITIEVASDNFHPYKVTEKAYNALIHLITDICERNSKKTVIWLADKEKTLNFKPEKDEIVMTVHRWFANKACPGEYLYNLHYDIMNKVNHNLNVIDTKIKRYNTYDDIPDYAKPTIKKMLDKKLLIGAGGATDINGYPVDLDLSLDMIRVFVTNDRAGLYD